MLSTVAHAVGLLGGRLLRLAAGLLALSVVVFVLLRVVPGDVAGAIIGRDADGAAPETQRQVERIRAALDLDRSLPEQYLLWITAPGRGDLGQGLWSRLPVLDEIRLAFLKTAELVLLAACVAAALGVPLGLLWARWRKGDGLLSLLALASRSFPVFWTGIMLFLVALLWFGWAPSLDYRGLFREPWQNLQLYLLPSLALGLGMVGGVMEAVHRLRSEIVTSTGDWARWVRGVWSEVGDLRGLAASSLAAAVVLEVVFAIPGLGWLMARSVAERDVPTLQWLLLFMGTLCWLLPARPGRRSGPDRERPPEGGARRPLAALGVVLVGGVAVAALAGAWLVPFDPARLDIAQRLLPPGLAHPLGTDEFGRDLLARLLYGSRVTLITAALAAGIAVAGGAMVGGLTGRWSGFGGRPARALFQLLSAFPPLILALAVVAMSAPTPLSVGLSVALVLAPRIPSLLEGRQRANGLPPRLGTAVALAPIAAAAFAQAILLEAHLSFLGLGPSSQGLTWGSLLGAHEPRLFAGAPWLAIFPGLAIGVTVLGFNLLAVDVNGRSKDHR